MLKKHKMSTPVVSRSSLQSKIPRPTRSRLSPSKKADTDVKVHKKIPTNIKSRSAAKYLKKEKSPKQGPSSQRHVINKTNTNTPKPTGQPDLCDEVFEASTEKVENILNSHQDIAFKNRQGSAFENERRSSIYYVPPRRQLSMQESHMEYKRNMKALHEKLRELNIKTPNTKDQDPKSPSTPKQSSRPSSIYYKIQPLTKDRSRGKLLFQPMSERKMLTEKKYESLCQSTSKLELAKGSRHSILHPQSAVGKENKSDIFKSANLKALKHLSRPVTSMTEIKEEEVDVSSTNACSTHTLPKDSVNLALSHNSSGLGHYIVTTTQSFIPTPSGCSTQSVIKSIQVSQGNYCQPLMSLSLLMAPTPPRSEVLHSTLSTPSTPKYSSVISSDTLSTWAVQNVVSTPILPKMGGCSWKSNDRATVMSTANNSDMVQSKVSHVVCSPFIHQTESTPQLWSNCPAAAMPQLTPRAPVLSSCLKSGSTNKPFEQRNVDVNRASCAKKLRWADMSAC